MMEVSMNTYEVYVGNIGNVYTGHNAREARRTFAEYVDMSRAGYGRAAGEAVSLLKNDEIVSDYIGAVNMNEE